VNAEYGLQRRAALSIAREHFGYEAAVLGRLRDAVGL
jgi:hypothetical protein